jgi:hypothetical protein
MGLLAVAFSFAFDSMSEQRPFLQTPSVNRPMTLGSEVHMQIKTKGYSGGGSQGSSVGHLGKMTMGFLPGTSASSESVLVCGLYWSGLVWSATYIRVVLGGTES